MSEQLNEKQEKFAQAYVMYRNATEAAKAAGYSGRSAHNQGSRLLKIASVKERIEDLEKEMETSIDYVAEIEKQYTYATNNNHTNSALKALELLSRLRSPTEEDAPQTIEELEKDIIKVSNYWVKKEPLSFSQAVLGSMNKKKRWKNCWKKLVS
jgi:phage terminase small subunit